MKNFIAIILSIAIMLCVSCFAEMYFAKDFIVSESTGYVWLGDINCKNAVLRIDYPEYGVIESQNIRLELNDLPTVMLWHNNDTTCAVFKIEYINSEIFATGACGCNPMIMDNFVTGIKDTDKDGIMWCAIAGNVIPVGTRIRVWNDAE